MKATALFLTLLLFTLNFVPCKDADATDGAVATDTSWNHSHSDDQGDDDCSPLCICNCCSVPSIPSTPLIIALQMAHVPIGYVTHHDHLLLDVSLPIWQPPQLSA